MDMHPQRYQKKTGFFDALGKTSDRSPRYYLNIVLGQFNAEVGEEALRFPTGGN